MKKIIPFIFALSMLFLASCEDSSDEVFADVQAQDEQVAGQGALADFDAHSRSFRR